MVWVQVYAPSQVLRIGLKLIGLDNDDQRKEQHETNVKYFKAHYGTYPEVIAQMWEDLQTTDIAEARITIPFNMRVTCGLHLRSFLRTFHFFMRYETEIERKCRIKNTEKTIRKWQWFFVEKMNGLKPTKIVWPADNEWDTFFGLSIDGVNCRYHEEKHPTLSKDPKQKDHKSKGAGLSYTLALHLWENRLIYLSGPDHAGADNDLGRYRKELKDLIPNGVVAVTDGGYNDHSDPKLAQPNSHDTPELRTFKARGRMRQECFHGRVEKFNCLTNDFRHDKDRHGQMFTAICIIVQYEMDMGFYKLWDT